MPKVSVIVPIYGVEKYIEHCARSLFEQTLDDMEYIFVDDCTKDNSIAILQRVVAEYPKRQAQTKIIHHEVNKGLPQARMTGLASATGDYITHCDSDDYADISMCKAMYEKAAKHNLDMVVCDYNIHKAGKIVAAKGCFTTDKETFIRHLLFSKVSWAVWNKLVKRTVYERINLICPKGSMSEDMVFTIQTANAADSIGYVESPLYYYRINESSMTIQPGEEAIMKKFIQVQGNIEIVEHYAQQNINYAFVTDGILHIKVSQNSLLIPLLHNRVYYRKWMDALKGYRFHLMVSPRIPLKDKMMFALVATRAIPFIFTPHI